jgi:hypothetical protein
MLCYDNMLTYALRMLCYMLTYAMRMLCYDNSAGWSMLSSLTYADVCYAYAMLRQQRWLEHAVLTDVC